MRRRLCLLTLLLAAWPGMARAQGGIIDFLESFSGPGPSYGYTVSTRALCVDKDKRVTWLCFSDISDDIRGVLQVDFSLPYLTSRSNPRFSDTPTDTRAVHTFKFATTYYYRFHPMIDLGAGVGAFVFSGEDVSGFTRLTLTPLSLSFVPLGWVRGSPKARKWGRFVRVEYSETYLTQGINASNFDSPSKYLKGGEFVTNVGIAFDLAVFLPRPK